MLVRKGVGWDDPLGEDERAQWRRWLEDLPKLSEIRVNRCFKPAVFGDIVEIQFVMGKARLAPIREISIPDWNV